MNIEKHKAFLDSLEPEKGLPDEMHGYRFDMAFSTIDAYISKESKLDWRLAEFLVEYIKRLRKGQIPDLKEKVKAFGLACMDAENARFDGIDGLILRGEFRALCEPEVKP